MHYSWPESLNGVFSDDRIINVSIGLIILTALYLSVQTHDLYRFVKVTALTSLISFGILMISGNYLFAGYDLREVSGILKSKQESGYEIVSYKEHYAGQYQFIGRLKKPVINIDSEPALREYLNSHKKTIVILYPPRKVSPEHTIYHSTYRTDQVFLLDNEGARKYLNLYI
jgi:hypothetical protein